MVDSGYDQSLGWVSVPISGFLLGITLVILLYHGHLGIVVVIDDYVRGSWRKRATQISAITSAVTGLSVIGAILSLFIGR